MVRMLSPSLPISSSLFLTMEIAGIVTGCDVELARTALGMIRVRNVGMVETDFAHPRVGQDHIELSGSCRRGGDPRRLEATHLPYRAVAGPH